MLYIIPILIISASFIAIYKCKIFLIPEFNPHWIAIAFLVKLVVAIFLVQLYSHQPREKVDLFRFYDDAKIINSSLTEKPKVFAAFVLGWWQNDKDYLELKSKTNHWDSATLPKQVSNNRFIIRYLTIVQWIVNNNYWSTVFITVLFGFGGLVLAFKSILKKVPKNKFLLYGFLFYFPSLLIWSSGLLKETLIISLLGVLFFAGFEILQKQNQIKNTMLFTLALIMLFQLRSIVAILFIMSALPFIWNQLRPTKRQLTTYFISFFIFISIASEAHLFYHENIWQILANKHIDFVQLALSENANTLISNQTPKANFFGIISFIPQAVSNAIFRPLPHEVNSLILGLILIENLIILILMTSLILGFNWDKTQKNLTLFLLSFSLIYLIIIGITTPVLGAIWRYKSIAIMMLFLALILHFDSKKLKEVFRKTQF